MASKFAGFMSYVRSDDQHERGRLSELCARLSGEVRIQLGEDFAIFQDRNDIAWGNQWKQRIEGAIDATTFLIPIITPGFFKSAACRDEVEQFIAREKQLGRGDLILPIYYVNCPVLGEEALRSGDMVAQVIADRQYADWRELRFEPFTTPAVGKTLASLASHIIRALDQMPAERREEADAPAAKAAGGAASEEDNAGTAEPAASQTARRTADPKKEPATLVVDALHRGDHLTITEALQAAQPGHRILVRPGLYREGIVIDKAVEIIGDGEPGEIVVEATGKNVIRFQANMGRVVNLTLRQMGGGKWFGVDVSQGRLELEGCDITSAGLACVAIREGADPRLRRNRIHNGKEVGVFIFDNGLGTFEDNEIFGNEFAGVEIRMGGNPTLRRNRIHSGKQGGVFVNENGLGSLEDNEIFSNEFAGVQIETGGNPTLRRNRIHSSKQGGVFIYDEGLGTLEGNEIFGNGKTGIEITKGSNPTIRGNVITRNAYEAVWVHDGGRGEIIANDLRGNAAGAFDIEADCKAHVRVEQNQE